MAVIRRTFSMPEEDAPYYEKFKTYVKDVSPEIVKFIKESVLRNELEQQGVEECRIWVGEQSEFETNGEYLRFIGKKIGDYFDPEKYTQYTVYKTRKGNYLIYWIDRLESESRKDGAKDFYGYKPFKDYKEVDADDLPLEVKTIVLNDAPKEDTARFLDI